MCGNERLERSIATLSAATRHPGRIGARGALLAGNAVLARLCLVGAPPLLWVLLRIARGAERGHEDGRGAERDRCILEHGRSPISLLAPRLVLWPYCCDGRAR